MTAYATPTPTTVPEIGALLSRLGLGVLHDATSPGGRSDNWLGTTSTGHRVFVKRLPRRTDGGPDGFTRSLAHAAAMPDSSPTLLGSDAETGLLVFAGIDGAESGVERALDHTFTTAMSAATGEQLARLHVARVAPGHLDAEPSTMPPLDWLEAVPWESVQAMNGAQLQAWRILQQDPDLRRALMRLRREEDEAPTTPIHADLRLDQVLVLDDDRVLLCDWECFRRGDPARDLGAWVGEWIYHSVFRIFAERDSAPQIGSFALTHEEVLRRGDENLTRNAAHVRAFWDAYARIRPIDATLRRRALRLAGWHVLDRFIAAAESQTSLHPVAKAAAGIGRAVLLDPDSAESLLADPRPETVTG